MNAKLSRYERDENGYRTYQQHKMCLSPKIPLALKIPPCTQDTSSNQDISATKDNGGIDAVVYAEITFTRNRLKHS